MKLGDIQHIIDKRLEETVLKQISKETFFGIIDESGIDLDRLSSKRKKNDYLPFHEFNFILKELHRSKRIDIAESAIYLETEMFTVKELLACLNEENLYELRVSLAERNNIPLKHSTLDLFLYPKKKRPKKRER